MKTIFTFINTTSALWRVVMGMFLAALFLLVLDMQLCFVPAVAAGFVLETILFSTWRAHKKFNWANVACATLGGVVIQLLSL